MLDDFLCTANESVGESGAVGDADGGEDEWSAIGAGMEERPSEVEGPGSALVEAEADASVALASAAAFFFFSSASFRCCSS
jgi:hypothetical protein